MESKILIVDDEKKIRDMICDYLEAIGFNTITAEDGVDAISMFISEKPDLIIMDVMMPTLDGIDATRRIRERSFVPIIMLTARAEESDKLMGLEMGADDYVVKPFSLKELGARVRAQLRRVSFSTPDVQDDDDIEFKISDLTMNVQNMTLFRGQDKITLTSVQFTILKLLISNPDRVFSRDQILNTFQEDLFEGYERTIDVHIKNIRKVLERNPKKPQYIETVYGAGYKLSLGNIQ